jgi:signal transduction histidine kinase
VSNGGLPHSSEGANTLPERSPRTDDGCMLAPAPGRASWSGSLLWVCSVLIAIAAAVLTVIAWSDLKPSDAYPSSVLPVAALIYATLGAMVIRRVRNRIGWLLLGEGLGIALLAFTSTYAVVGVLTHPGALPAAKVVGALSEWIFVPILMGLIYLVLVFPTGAPPSLRWRPISTAVIAVAALSLVGFIVTPRQVALPAPGGVSLVFPNPLGIRSLGPGISTTLLGTLSSLSVPSVLLLAAAAVALVARYRSGEPDLRQQIKWMAFATVAWVILQGVLALAQSSGDYESPVSVVTGLASGLVALVLIPIAITVAILKYRLYDIDVVINKTVVFGVLAAFITAVYVAIVVGIGALVGSGNKPNLGLSILATAIVAVAFEPVRERVQHFANRLVYGQRATPYQVLSEFSDRMAGTYASEEVLPKMARVIKEGTGAERAEVWLRSQDELRLAATWPKDSFTDAHALALSDGRLPPFEGHARAIDVRHQGQLLGALVVAKPQSNPLTPAEDKLLFDLASQAGLVLRNVALTSELLARLEELRASRQRLVAAQDEERRRLERNLHDGAQQHLVSLKTRMSLARKLIARDAAVADELLTNLEADASEALETLRDLARGIYPPLLADSGLAVAIQAQARKVSVPVEVHADHISRYPQEIEAAVYFCCLEALQNVSKYAHASSVTVTLQESDLELSFSVADDGSGFDPKTTPKGSGTQNMADRLEALGGTVQINSGRDRGTTVRGELPVQALETARPSRFPTPTQ